MPVWYFVHYSLKSRCFCSDPGCRPDLDCFTLLPHIYRCFCLETWWAYLGCADTGMRKDLGENGKVQSKISFVVVESTNPESWVYTFTKALWLWSPSLRPAPHPLVLPFKTLVSCHTCWTHRPPLMKECMKCDIESLLLKAVWMVHAQFKKWSQIPSPHLACSSLTVTATVYSMSHSFVW